jgi:LysR family hydrogen peroxide-inducible transcriptional activator
MDLDQLRYFLRVAERQSFTKAAADLAISQPALSRSIQKLEEDLGLPVFERQARAVVLTDAGRLLQSRARQALALLDDTRTEITDDGRSGRLRIGAIPTVAPYFLPDVLRRFTKAFPNASVVVREETTALLLKACGDGEIDLGILALPVSAPSLDVEALFEEELLLVMPPDHPLASRPTIRIADIESLPFILLDEAHCLTDTIVSFCKQRSFQPVAVERTSQLATVQELVSLAHGVSMIPAMASRCDRSDQRVYRSLAGRRPTRTIAAVWNPYRFQSRLLISFRDLLRGHGPPAGRHAD